MVLLALQALWSRLWVAEQFRSALGPPILSSLFIILALALVAANSHHRGWKLAGAFFVLYFGINQLNTLDEALLFKIGLQVHEALRMTAAGFCTALSFAPLLVLILGCWENSREDEIKLLVPRSATEWLARTALGDIFYVLCFFIAAVATYPFVKDFYSGFTLPKTASFLEIEVLRGLVYVAAGLVVINGMKGERGRAAATLGLAFPILAGVAPLLVHNPYLPDYVRLAHGFEIGISNLPYGALLGHILTRRAAGIEPQEAEGAESIL